MKKILFCGGGTAGHVTPNVALIQRLIGRYSLYYLGVGGLERRILRPFIGKGLAYSEFAGVKFRRKISAELFKLPVNFRRAVGSCRAVLSLYKPDLVVSKGGYGGLPVVIAAHGLKIPCVAHESDYSLGLANRLSLPFVEKMFAVFPYAAEKAGKKGVLCAPPLRREVFGNASEVLRKCNFAKKKPVLLVLGGSSGSEKINEALSGSLGYLTENFNVIALTGKNKAVAGKGEGLFQTEFADRIGDYYACADVAVSRAGSNTLSELMANGIPSLLIPLESGSRGEQVKNALSYEKKGCAKILFERDLTPLSLKNQTEKVFLSRNEIKRNIASAVPHDSVMLDYIENRLS